MICWKVT